MVGSESHTLGCPSATLQHCLIILLILECCIHSQRMTTEYQYGFVFLPAGHLFSQPSLFSKLLNSFCSLSVFSYGCQRWHKWEFSSNISYRGLNLWGKIHCNWPPPTPLQPLLTRSCCQGWLAVPGMLKVAEVDPDEDADLLLQAHAQNLSPYHHQSPLINGGLWPPPGWRWAALVRAHTPTDACNKMSSLLSSGLVSLAFTRADSARPLPYNPIRNLTTERTIGHQRTSFFSPNLSFSFGLPSPLLLPSPSPLTLKNHRVKQ